MAFSSRTLTMQNSPEVTQNGNANMSDGGPLSLPTSSSRTAGGSSYPIEVHQRVRRTVVAAVLFVIALGAHLVSRFTPAIPEPLPEFFLALTAAMAVHLLDRLWLFRDTAESMDQLRGQIVGNVAKETAGLIDLLNEHTKEAMKEILASIQKSIKSLEAMTRTGMLRIYANREEASEDISQDVTSQLNQKIRFIGISLNDFVLRKDPKLGQAWQILQGHIESGNAPSRSLDIKVLIIDPTSFGAQLRSRGEERSSRHNAGRLKHDVDIVIDELLQLEANCKQVGVKFECRLYRLPPVLFLCLTDTACYVQQYHFWSSRLDNKSFPIIRLQNVQTAGGLQSLHAELEQHFNWVWEKASVGLAEYRVENSLGVDKGVAQSGMVNVFTDPNEGLTRMEYLLRTAEQRVCIQGNSLHSFFNRSDPKLYRVISKLLMDDIVDIDLLFLNPDCEQAQFRAFREYSFDNPEVTRSEYFASSNEAHARSALYIDTITAKKVLQTMVREISAAKPTGWKPKLKAAFYDSAPYCFLLRVDNTVLIEQYHYGKLPDELHGARITLGKDFPLIEYHKVPSEIFEQTKKTPFALLESHFEFAFSEAERLPVDQWAGAVPSA